MYNLPYHKENDPVVIKEFIERYPFAFLTGCDHENKPVATQVPVFMEEKDGKRFLSGHIMKNTDHHKAFLHNNNVLAVFTGHQTYVSGTWYSNPHTASTWNYMSVHMKGTIRFADGAALEEILRKTSLHFENYNRESTTIYENLSSEYKHKLLHAIAAFEIDVTETDTVFKLSQDRDSISYQNIIEKLSRQNPEGKVIADEMERRYKELYKDK